MVRTPLLALALALNLACSGTGGSSIGSVVADVAAQNLWGQIGGADATSSLARNYLTSLAEDGRVSGLVGDTLSDSGSRDAIQLKLSDQLCSMLGGGCAPSLTEEQIAKGAERLTPEQTQAVDDNLGRSLSETGLSSTLQDAVSKAIAPKLPGIVGALL
jgi:hypothetical protein